jgi:hypothetical protein
MRVPDTFPIAAFTLAHYPKAGSLAAMAHLGMDRWPLAHTSGLRFWRLFGVGKGRVFDPRADLQRTALFTIWDSTVSLKQFENSSNGPSAPCALAWSMGRTRPVCWLLSYLAI